MRLDELKPAEGSKFTRKRVGRGIGSGTGKTSGKGFIRDRMPEAAAV